jgi:hypothetical protein
VTGLTLLASGKVRELYEFVDRASVRVEQGSSGHDRGRGPGSAARVLSKSTTRKAMDTNAVIVAVLVALSLAAAFVALGIALAN